MKITTVSQKYAQKSRLFVYPLLGIRRGVSVTPVGTYLTWRDMYTVVDCKFIAVYHLRDDAAFKQFEKRYLIGNRHFDNFFELEDGDGAYVFDFKEYKMDYKMIVNGKYSKITPANKIRIAAFFKNNHVHHQSIHSWLYPERFHKDYAKVLGVDLSLIKQVYETCSLPDLRQENLEVKKKVVNFATVNHL